MRPADEGPEVTMAQVWRAKCRGRASHICSLCSTITSEDTYRRGSPGESSEEDNTSPEILSARPSTLPQQPFHVVHNPRDIPPSQSPYIFPPSSPVSPIMASTLSEKIHSAAADPTKLSYFSLPGEIRNQIMDLVFVHGDIYPGRPTLETSTSGRDTTAKGGSQPGIQMIATCKQAYQEGLSLFYSSNTFHLPPTITFDWADGLQAKHKDMIKRISITIGLDELTAEMISQIERSVPIPPGVRVSDHMNSAVQGILRRVWISKMSKIAAWSSLEEVELCSFNHTCILQHRDVVANLDDMDPDIDSLYWHTIWRWPQLCVWGTLFPQIDRLGWKGTVEWLSTRKQGEMAEGFWVVVRNLDPRIWSRRATPK